MVNRKRNSDEEAVDAFQNDGNPSQPEDTSDVKAEQDRATFAAQAAAASPDAPRAEEVDFKADLPAGVSANDVDWWRLPQNQNYMAGDGPLAGITEVDGTAQSASSVDPQIRAETLEQSRRDEADSAARAAESTENDASDDE